MTFFPSDAAGEMKTTAQH